jgi:HxlR-like helix-turn-helix
MRSAILTRTFWKLALLAGALVTLCFYSVADTIVSVPDPFDPGQPRRLTQKMLGQQLRSLAADGIVVRTAYPQVPPKVEYRLTPWGQSLCPALDAILKWADRRPAERRRRNSC